ncbi:hypothetical protein UFOVP378_37 [uncultured Caudovirales phage]|uniref:Uncharacterized protein n=1 Tax=uncultured Caudovirales phage TaxID=2100421 RepID=A0A6J7WXW4_9CAUD|nr:hypothetical protein UFOVP378_37 [uncultured Caudovirales phage]
MTKLAAKQFYLDQVKKDNSPHRRIANRMAGKFDISPALVKNELLKDGYITIAKTVRLGETQKLNFYFKLTGKTLQTATEQRFVSESQWEDGTPKSRGNAFDITSAKGLFSKAEIANATNKGKPNNYNTTVQMIAYSRA